jgi:imidazolonepropionase-like amidohydrolase
VVRAQTAVARGRGGTGVATSWLLRRATVLDETGTFDGPVDVTVVDGSVVAVGDRADAPTAIPVDCDGLFLLPGVFDCHDHVALSTLDQSELLRTPITEWSLRAAANMARTLRAGVTFVRDAGGADAGMRDAVAKGYVEGPRLQVAVMPLCQTGGHFDGFLPGPGIELFDGYLVPEYPGRPPYRVDGVDEMRRTVRMLLRGGADWIKLCATGGITSAYTEDDEPELTLEEIEVAVEEAARKGKGVMAHAFGGQGLDNAVAAGVRSIEHGLFLTEEQASRMASAGTWLVPTLVIVRDLIRWARDGIGSPATIRKALEIEPKLGDVVAIARDAGVRIALGTDFVQSDQHGLNLEELLLMSHAGLTPAETFRAATVGGAELCGVADRYGRIAPGQVFDAILLDDDPSDLTVFARADAVTGVFKGGTAVVPHPRLTADVGALT